MLRRTHHYSLAPIRPYLLHTMMIANKFPALAVPDPPRIAALGRAPAARVMAGGLCGDNRATPAPNNSCGLAR